MPSGMLTMLVIVGRFWSVPCLLHLGCSIFSTVFQRFDMVYMGSKNRLSKYLLPFILSHLSPQHTYVEPFCGGCNLIDKVRHPHRIASDVNFYLIELFRALQAGVSFPSHISQEEYCLVRSNPELFEPWYVGFVGFVCSFRGKWFNGFVPAHTETRTGVCRNYQQELISNFLKSRDALLSVKFEHCSYQDLEIPSQSIVYCDPPYFDSTSYSAATDFDHTSFWAWCREQTAKGLHVLVSEYTAPDDFVCVWSMQVGSRLSSKQKLSTECLFVHESLASLYLAPSGCLF